MRENLIYTLLVAMLVAGCGSVPSRGPTTAGGADPEPKTVKEWMAKQPRAKKKAMLGAALGAVFGAVVAKKTGKDPVDGALIGATVGGLAGYAFGKRQDKIYAGRDAAVAEIQYDSTTGYVMQIQDVQFRPARVRPGQRTEVYVKYLVVGPDRKEDLVVESYTGIKYDASYISARGPESFTVPRGGGIVETTASITIPKDAPAGTYSIETMFADSRGRFERSEDQPLYISAG